MIPGPARRPRYYVRPSFNNREWWMVCQVVNNVVVADCPEQKVAELITSILNDLPNYVLGRLLATKRKHSH